MAYVFTSPDSEPASLDDKTSTKERRHGGARGFSLPWLAGKLSDPNRSLLLLRFGLLNLLAFSLLGVAYAQGYVHKVIAADTTLLSVVIFIVFLVGLALCAHKVWQTSTDLDEVLTAPSGSTQLSRYLQSLAESSRENRGNVLGALRMQLSYRISVVRHLANVLVLLGLIGTVLGFIIALSGVDPEHASDVNAIAPMVSTLIQGMSTALYTTLVGSILNVWLMANHQLLAGGTVKLIGALMEADSNERD